MRYSTFLNVCIHLEAKHTLCGCVCVCAVDLLTGALIYKYVMHVSLVLCFDLTAAGGTVVDLWPYSAVWKYARAKALTETRVAW